MKIAMATTLSRRVWLSRMLLAAVAPVVGARLADPVDAKKSPGSYQNAFTKACRERGGTPKRVRSRVVKCTFADGTVVECDFNHNPPSCTKALTNPPTKPGGGGAVPPSDGVNEDPTGTGGSPVGGGVDPSGGNEQPTDPGGSGGGGQQAGGGAAVDPTGGVEQPSDSGGVTITAYDGGGTQDQATHHDRRHRQGHGKRR